MAAEALRPQDRAVHCHITVQALPVFLALVAVQHLLLELDQVTQTELRMVQAPVQVAVELRLLMLLALAALEAKDLASKKILLLAKIQQEAVAQQALQVAQVAAVLLMAMAAAVAQLASRQLLALAATALFPEVAAEVAALA